MEGLVEGGGLLLSVPFVPLPLETTGGVARRRQWSALTPATMLTDVVEETDVSSRNVIM
jgi:hypothetical protein